MCLQVSDTRLTARITPFADGAEDIMWGTLDPGFGVSQASYAAPMMQERPSMDTEELSALLGFSLT